MKFRTFFDAPSVEGEICKTPSCTVTDDYEDLDVMVKRIIRGEIMPKSPQVFEFSCDDSKISDDDFDRPVVDNLDDLTDITDAANIINSAKLSASAGTKISSESAKHGAAEDTAKPEISGSDASDVGVSGADGN